MLCCKHPNIYAVRIYCCNEYLIRIGSNFPNKVKVSLLKNRPNLR
jgi:hypothetical protein